MKNNSKGTGAVLSWRLKDYHNSKIEVPARIRENSQKTEGEMMSEEEIENWMIDSLKTLEILEEENADVFARIYKGFLADLEYLGELGKIEEDVLLYIKEKNNFDFDKENE